MQITKLIRKFGVDTFRKSLNSMTGRYTKYATYIWTTQNKQ